METSRATLEESIFGQAGANNEVAATRYRTAATSWTGNTTGWVSQTGTWCGHNVGPNTLQKVMAGDVVNATVLYYHEGGAGGNSPNMVSTVLGSLLQAISGGNAASSLVKGNAGNITNQLSGVSGFINAVQPGGSNPSSGVPQAFLTVLFFDERFNFIAAGDGGVAQQQVDASVGSNGSSLTLANIKAPKNGYVFIYVSNQSNKDVYFDNLQVGIVQGNIAEENHYYAYGLKIATLSSKKLGDVYEGTLKNNYLYNEKELFDDADLNWYDYGFRSYDPQIGRFPQLDPLTDRYPYLTPYQYASCDPITNIDVDGLEGCPSVSGMTGYVGNVSRAAGGGSSIGRIFNGISAVARIAGPAASIANLAVNVINTKSQQTIVKQQLATKSINGGFTTEQTGDKVHGPNTGDGGSTGVSDKKYDDKNDPLDEPKSYWPLYKSLDAAAAGFANWVNTNDGGPKQKENSALLYQIVAKNGISYYSYTYPRQYVTDYGEHHSPPPEQLRKYNLLPQGDYKIYESGFIHNHTYANEPDGNIGSPDDADIIGRNPNMAFYFLNSAGTLYWWRTNNRDFVDIVRGYKRGPVKAVEKNFNEGKGVDMTVVNYYDIF